MSKNRHHNVQDSRPNGGVDSGLVGKIAPAVALLLLGESAFAEDDEDVGDDFEQVPEPGALALFAAGAAAAGAVKYIRKKRGK